MFGSVLINLAVVITLVTSITSTPVTPAKCVTFQKGTLTTREIVPNGQPTHVFKPFAWNWRNELAFYHQTPHPTIQAEFQMCTPNLAQSPNNYMDKWGRIYIPATKKCLAITNPNSSGPYYITFALCLNSSAGEMNTSKSIPQNFVNSRGFIAWTGSTRSDRSVIQGGCAGGQWGYRADATYEPVSNKAGEYRIELVCQDKNSRGSNFWLKA